MTTVQRHKEVKIKGDAYEKASLQVIKGRKARNTTIFIYSISVLMIFAALFITVLGHVFVEQQQLKIDNLSSRLSTLQRQHQKLSVQVAQLESPSRIEKDAQNNYGMIPPSSIIFLKSIPLPTNSSDSSSSTNQNSSP